MSGFNKLSYDELVQINDELRYTIANLKKQQEEYEQCTARVYAPGKSYKELENQLAKSETEKTQEIAEILETKVEPLNRKIVILQNDYSHLKSRNRDLERIIEKQNVVITFAAGYISASQKFADKHPIDVKKWLMGGME